MKRIVADAKQSAEFGPTPAAVARCPRCGYDQRGVVETWKDACPLDGVCSECGLAFAWPDLFRPERFAPQWCVEFTPRVIGLPWAAVKTAIRSCWPWHFWKRVQMGHPIHAERVVAYLCLLLMMAFALYAAPQATIAALVLKRHRDTAAASHQALPAAIAKWQSLSATQIGFCGPFQREGFDFGTPSVRLVDHVYRDQMRQGMLDSMRASLNTPPRYDFSTWQAMLEAVARPWAEQSSLEFVYLDVYRTDDAGQPTLKTVPYSTSPESLWLDFFDPARTGGWFYARGPWRELREPLGAMGVWCGLLLAPLPLSLALLPVTRKRAKVRWAHVGRVFLYSLSIPIAIMGLVIAAWMTRTFADPTTRWDEEFWMLMVVLAMPIATIAWWWAAIKHYLRMPHALAVSIIMSVLCVLMIGAIIFVIGETFFA